MPMSGIINRRGRNWIYIEISDIMGRVPELLGEARGGGGVVLMLDFQAREGLADAGLLLLVGEWGGLGCVGHGFFLL